MISLLGEVKKQGIFSFLFFLGILWDDRFIFLNSSFRRAEIDNEKI
jgi:hypothetical protein